MNPWLLVPTSIAAVYLLLMMLRLIFRELDMYHAAKRRRGGVKQAGRSGDC